MKFLDHPTRNLFFTGKGGVGKTSVACATAVRLADAGKKVLLVSTDPASNLDEVLGVTLGNHPTAIPAIPTLFAMNLDPEKSAAEYRERMVGPYRGLLPEAAVKSMEEQFSGSCTLEIAAFDEFSRLLGDPNATAEFDHVIFDTAPTGHTLRLLTLPSAWDGFIKQSTSGTSCLGPLAGLQSQQKLYQESVKALGDPVVTTLVLVARAETSALREAARTSGELAELGVRNQHLVVNGVFQASDSSDPYAVALEQRGSAALAAMPEGLKNLPQTVVPLSPDGIVGIDSLRQLVGSSVRGRPARIQTETDGTSVHREESAGGTPALQLHHLADLIDDLVAPGHGVILAMGKGGVGKTTVAAAVAVAIAERGYEVHLSTTDPAAHIAAALDNDHLPNLTVSRIDPAVETAKYSAEVLGKAGKNLDAQGKALLEEDLRSPCTEEIAVFRAFADAVAAGTNKFVVLDTAPTGHTVLLLDSALAYHREVTRQSSEMPEAVENLLPRLRDPNFTRVLIVTLPEATPVHEAAALQRDLRRAEIEPYAWVVNQVLSPLPITDPLLKQRQLHEQKYLREVNEVHASRAVIIPWQLEPPTGLERLSQLTQSGRDARAPVHGGPPPPLLFCLFPLPLEMLIKLNHTTKPSFASSFLEGAMEQGNSTSSHKGWYGRGYHPHCDYPGLIQSIGFRLFDSVPAKVIERWEEEIHRLPDSQKRTELNNRIDRYADQGYGGCFLADVRIAELTENALLHFDGDRYDLLAWCVMPNHVHALIATRIGYPLAEILHSWKSFTAHRANKVLNRNGDFWLADFFDQFMRTSDQMETTIMYIEFNPVKARLVESPSLWRFSSSAPMHQQRVKNNRIKYPSIDPSSLPDFRC